MHNAEFDRLTSGLTSKSDKIRTLARNGVPTADIARYLGVRYQHARNVLVESGLHRVRSDASPGDEANLHKSEGPPSPRSIWLDVDSQGRLALPEAIMAAAGIRPGDAVNVYLNGSALEIRSRQAALRRAQTLVEHLVPPGSAIVDDFIAARRREAGREEDVTGSRRTNG